MTAPKKVTYGQTITYTVKVANTGTASAHNVTVTVVPPPGVDTPSAMTPASQCALVRQDRAAMGRDAVVCNLGTLTTQSAATVTVTVKPLYVQHSPFKGEAYDTTTDREMSPTSSTHAKASVKVACPPQGPCNVQ
jgi:uncharacterized repeat protein (TIGR01451 family)